MFERERGVCIAAGTEVGSRTWHLACYLSSTHHTSPPPSFLISHLIRKRNKQPSFVDQHSCRVSTKGFYRSTIGWNGLSICYWYDESWHQSTSIDFFRWQMEWMLELNELTPGLLPVFSADRGLFWIKVDADKTFLSHDNLAGGVGNLFSNCPASSFPDLQTLFCEHFASCDPCYFKPSKRSRPTWNLCRDLKPSVASGQTSTYCTQYIFPTPEQH